MANKAKALYVHIPFCNHICAYCDFVRVGYHQDLADRYLVRLIKELQQYEGYIFDSIYIGGGTPSALNEHQLDFLLSSLTKFRSNQCEFTMEANPESLTIEKIEIAHHYGVNRISLGVQAIQPHLLQVITRKHQTQDVLEVLKHCRRWGIDNISIDAIYGLPFQSLEDFRETCQWIIDTQVPHVSLYALTIEENTLFKKQNVLPVSIDLEEKFYQLAIDLFTQAGFHHYEISNFAQVGQESIHNSTYWQYKPYAAIGLGAVGMENHVRYTHTANIHTYCTSDDIIKDQVILDQKDEMFEYVMMGLRLSTGINKQHFFQRFNQNIEQVFPNAIARHIKKGWLLSNDTHLLASGQGWRVLHDILVDFLPD